MNEIQEKEKLICKIGMPILKVIYVIIITALCCLIIGFTQYTSISRKNYIIENDKQEIYKSIPFQDRQVWILYYSSYANIENDDHWGDWRFRHHEYEKNFHEPPDEIPSCYYPKEGIYSSHNESLIEKHMSMIKSANIDAIVVPWYGPEHNDIILLSNITGFTDQTMQLLMKYAAKNELKIIPMIPNYQKRNASIVLKDLEYFEQKYSNNEAIYKCQNNKPLVFIYDIQNFADAAEVINTKASTFEFIGSGVNYNDFLEAFEDGAVGYITFFAAEGFSWSSTAENWPFMAKFSNQKNILFVPTVSPGYNDSVVNHWNMRFIKPRECSKYYNSRWEKAIKTGTNVIMINSFNGWKEATNIEPAQNRKGFQLTNDNWCNDDEDYYLKVTKEWITKFKGSQ